MKFETELAPIPAIAMDPYHDFIDDSKILEDMKEKEFLQNKRYNAMNPYNRKRFMKSIFQDI